MLLRVLSLLAPLVVILFAWNKRYTLLWFYALAGLFFDNLGQLLSMTGKSHYWPGNLFLLTEYILFSLFYRPFIMKSKRSFGIMFITGVLMVVITTSYNGFFKFNSYGATILCALYLIFGLGGFRYLLVHADLTPVWQKGFFWINTAVFLYASGSFLLFLFMSFLLREDLMTLIKIWGNYYVCLNILRYIFLAIGLTRKQQ